VLSVVHHNFVRLVFASRSATQAVRVFTVTLIGRFPRLMSNRFAKEPLTVFASENHRLNVFGRTTTTRRIRPTKYASAHTVSLSNAFGESSLRLVVAVTGTFLLAPLESFENHQSAGGRKDGVENQGWDTEQPTVNTCENHHGGSLLKLSRLSSAGQACGLSLTSVSSFRVSSTFEDCLCRSFP